jgi:hypothetical protein
MAALGPRDYSGHHTPASRTLPYSAINRGRCPLLPIGPRTEAGNSSDPIAARSQGHPQSLAALLGTEAVTSIEARGGSAYNFLTRPFQHRRPRTIRLNNAQQAVVASEISRLQLDCQAVEDAPPHDGDKALLPSAPAWERAPLRVGPWPREQNGGFRFSQIESKFVFTTRDVGSIRFNGARKALLFAILNRRCSRYLKRTETLDCAPITGNSTCFSEKQRLK